MAVHDLSWSDRCPAPLDLVHLDAPGPFQQLLSFTRQQLLDSASDSHKTSVYVHPFVTQLHFGLQTESLFEGGLGAEYRGCRGNGWRPTYDMVHSESLGSCNEMGEAGFSQDPVNHAKQCAFVGRVRNKANPREAKRTYILAVVVVVQIFDRAMPGLKKF